MALRADATRNHARILDVAEEQVATHGADASLEQIARIAGVGSATVRRHFPSRAALLHAVFTGRVRQLCDRAQELQQSADPRAALLEWLELFTDYAAAARGLSSTVVADTGGDCSVELAQALQPLVDRAIEIGAVPPGRSATDLLTLIAGLAMATERQPNPGTAAHRLLAVAIDGISPA